LIFRFDGTSARAVAAYNNVPGFKELWADNPILPNRGTVTGRAIVERRAIHVPDVLADPEYNPPEGSLKQAQKLGQYRTTLGVPMLREGFPLGTIVLWKTKVEPYTDKQIELVTTFADQAVIAIENTRLFEAEKQRTRELTESLEQQTATSEVLGVISRSKFELQPILQSVVDTASRLCRADVSVIFRLEGGAYRFAAGYSLDSLDPAYLDHERRTPISPGPGTVVGRAAMSREVVQIEDAWTDPLYEQKAAVKISGGRSMIGVPLMREGKPIGVIGLARTRVEPFTRREIDLVTTFADQAVIAIENVRLFEAEQQRTRELTESLEQQTATSEVLQVISSSPGDIELVLHSMLEKAVRICQATFGNIYRWDGHEVELTASHNVPPAFAEHRRRSPYRPSEDNAFGRMIATKKLVHAIDAASERAYTERREPGVVAAVELGGVRTYVAVPLLKDDGLIGVLTVYRQEVRPFTDKQMELLSNFAAQAVIAVENARLLNELRQRTDDLTESLEQQTGTSEILEVISNSPTDSQPAFDAIVRSGLRLFPNAVVVISLPDSD
jgi:GAF domain-containing protein